MAGLLGKVAPTGEVCRDRDRSRSTCSTTTTKPSKSGNGQATMTVTVPQDSNKRKVQSIEGAPRAKRQRRAGKPKGDKKQNEGLLPPQSVPVGGRLYLFMEGWKHITNDPCVLSIIANGYRLQFMSPLLLLKTPRVPSSNRLKANERPPRHTSLSHADHKLSAEYRRKRRLRVKNRSA